jgi:hypothetical protein
MPRILWNPTVHCRAHNSPPPVPILRNTNSALRPLISTVHHTVRTICRSVRTMPLVITHLSPLPCHYVPLSPNYPPQLPMFLPSSKDKVSQSQQTTSKITVPYILIVTSLHSYIAMLSHCTNRRQHFHSAHKCWGQTGAITV